MDPLTQGTLGAALTQTTRQRKHITIAGGLGFLAGLAPDLDILIRSDTDPLLFLEYHRQFTHSLLFIPVGALIIALGLHLLLRRWWKLSLLQTWAFCTLGYATHGLLDSATSYGTMLFWPISDVRYAWSIISIIDPLLTLPLLVGVLLTTWLKTPVFARAGLLWALSYLLLGAWQHQNALDMGHEIAATRGHQPDRIEVKPSFGNILVWKVIYEAEGRYYVDAVRAGLGPEVFTGTSVAKLDPARDLDWLQMDSQQAKDLERFHWFSDGFLAIAPTNPDRIIDVRYSLLPNEISGLWSIELSPDAMPKAHVRFHTHRDNARESFDKLWQMISGDGR